MSFRRTHCRQVWSVIAVGGLTLQACGAATNAADELAPPQLAPPYPALPPTFWEQYGVLVIVGSIVALGAIGLLIWIALRKKPVAALPPEVQAQQALDALRGQPEDGATLSRISDVLHRYFSAAFGLPAASLTTTEFARELSRSEKVGPALAGKVSDFLRQCDERKFSRTPATTNLEAVPQALALLDAGEKRRRELAAAQTSSPP